MKRTRKQPPTFESSEEEAEFWEQHDTTEFELGEVREPIVLSPRLKAKILRRWRKLKAVEWLPLPETQARRLKVLARRKKIPWELLVYQWLEERLRSEGMAV